jgi:hypothetical protein
MTFTRGCQCISCRWKLPLREWPHAGGVPGATQDFQSPATGIAGNQTRLKRYYVSLEAEKVVDLCRASLP